MDLLEIGKVSIGTRREVGQKSVTLGGKGGAKSRVAGCEFGRKCLNRPAKRRSKEKGSREGRKERAGLGWELFSQKT